MSVPEKTGIVVTLHTLWDEQCNHVPEQIADVSSVQQMILRAATIDMFLAVSDQLAEAAVKQGCPRPRVRVINNGIDSKQFAPLPPTNAPLAASLWRDGESPIIRLLVAGRISPEKGVVEFLSNFSSSFKANPNLQLLVLGEKNERDYISERYHARLLALIQRDPNLKAHVRLGGNIPNAMMPAILQASDIVVHPSLHEGQSLFVLEAMASARPIVCFRIRGMKEILAHGISGLTSVPGDYASLAKHILRLADSHQLRRNIGQKARSRVLAAFSRERTARAVACVYREVIAKRKRICETNFSNDQ